MAHWYPKSNRRAGRTLPMIDRCAPLGATPAPIIAMNIALLYFDDCPNWRVVESRLHEALKMTGHDAVEIERLEVTSPEHARDLQFTGSPMILIDGTDPFADQATDVGLSCRLFFTPDGLAGSPTLEQLIGLLGR